MGKKRKRLKKWLGNFGFFFIRVYLWSKVEMRERRFNCSVCQLNSDQEKKHFFSQDDKRKYLERKKLFSLSLS